jgi:hypothetical protein
MKEGSPHVAEQLRKLSIFHEKPRIPGYILMAGLVLKKVDYKVNKHATVKDCTQEGEAPTTV